ncbi:mechanosensitive ion channel domain-containing protein [Halosegnis marinus]|uniref:Mechanosensitive ion channel domain-containing protein n=1 Tax=Halosegnis marinus TaxID=3034023 RepID=A0ABD5ZKT6_9EURY|nr:mechanosensitive ion channel domain-containing protein [Halosegnis sp. DT85]
MPHDAGGTGLDATLHRLLADRFELFVGIVVFLLALVAGVLTRRYVRRLLRGLDVPTAVEGTPFERTAQRLGTSTVGLLANLCGLFVLVVGGLVALRLVNALPQDLLTTRLTDFFRQLFIAVIVLIVGVITGDKLDLYVRERLRSVKVPEAGIVPTLAKYSVFYVAALVALSQLGVATLPLLVLLAAYAFGLVLLGGLATKDLLASAAAGVYLLLTEPYAIGDEVEVDGRRGIVQEVDTFVTRVEAEGEEYVVPNHRVFRRGIVVVRS